MIPAHQAWVIVEELRNTDVAHPNGMADITRRVNALKDGGWKMGIQSYRLEHKNDRRGNALKRPRHSWRNICHFFNGETKEKIFYWNNLAQSKAGAERMAEKNPVPGGFDSFITIVRDNNTGIITHAGQAGVSTGPACPECEKLRLVSQKSQAIGEFLDWLQSEKHVQFCAIHKHSEGCIEWKNGRSRTTCGYQDDEYMPFHHSIEKLLAEYFKIDLNKVESEKRALLDHLRTKQ